MAYDFNLEVTTSISRSLAEQIIRQAIEDQTGKKVKTIEPRLVRSGKGGNAETYDSVFDGFAVTFEPERPAGPSNDPNVNRGFVKATYQ